jgi:N utilization substance protein B
VSATPRDIRRLAFQTLFQLDARGEKDAAAIEASLEDADGFEPRDRKKAFDLAMRAFAARNDADKSMRELAPTWPAHRQPAPDRAILRLAHYEMHALKVHPVIIVNEAVELAKHFSTDKSPGFVNALLDKILKEALPKWDAAHPGAPNAPSTEPSDASVPHNTDDSSQTPQ